MNANKLIILVGKKGVRDEEDTVWSDNKKIKLEPLKAISMSSGNSSKGNSPLRNLKKLAWDKTGEKKLERLGSYGDSVNITDFMAEEVSLNMPHPPP